MWALLALLNLELHPLTFFKGAIPSHLNLRLMYEEVLGTVVGNDEPESLIAVEPLHYACTHYFLTFEFTQ